MKNRDSKIVAFAGGKGGTGKSSLALCFADRYANSGKKTIIVDLDLGGSNMHTMLGIHSPKVGLSDYLFENPENRDISNFITQTDIENLSLLPSNSITPGAANIEYQRKLKIIRAIKSLNYEIIILDIGAGSSFNTVDFFEEADIPVIVTTPEPTSIINAYEFLKNTLFREFKRSLKNNRTAINILNEIAKNGKNIFELIDLLSENSETEASAVIKNICESNSIILIMNRTKNAHTGVGNKLQELSKRFLNIDINYISNIQENSIFSKAVITGAPATQLDPALGDVISELLF